MKKDYRLNLRLAEATYRELVNHARTLGMSPAECVRTMIQANLRTDTDAVIRRLARQILFTSLATQSLLRAYGRDEDVDTVAEEVRRLSGQLGISDG